ncbi:hypothetical protein BTA51_05635 [Hahella sp. CCB-MM4]|uniref:hypothetical protein n=1 Tax=Hahella sp. (strain CCB-MM4) TaxID=1926491 RepID=UPI000B9A9EA9|nr:hypothetical protein [Hahella sp. CCB-MM4]OZG74486.1 hypothetical protein BTA51_05635 [Hahella sp. CCB-MM4]
MKRVVFLLSMVLVSSHGMTKSLGSTTESMEKYMVSSSDYVAGHPVSDYANRWWMWAFSVPDDVSPVRDKSGEFCQVSQQGDVWFLAGGYGSSKIKRTCVVPAGKYLFFPVINMAYWPRKEGAMTCDEAKKLAALNNDKLLNIQVSLDSVVARNPVDTRISSTSCFDIYEKIPRKYNPPKLYPSATDGYWVMLKPLDKGKHMLKFSAQYDREKGAYSKMAQDIEYELIIQ